MRCSDATRQLQLYIDNRLTLEQVRTLEAHVARCSTCQHDLLLLEEVVSCVRGLPFVLEPENMTVEIMQRVALSSQHPRAVSLLRPSLQEWLTAVLLASITTLGIILQQPSLRANLPFANGPFVLAFLNTLHLLVSGDIGTLTWVLWIGGTLLGICITLVLVGNEIRSEWFKTMREHLPVHDW